ncbi:DUF1569 domain-containing protein [Tautonia marina]|uniref:DUF1569 domain-containing protein n=1 Tax=Tautonia marina TaxID=2653855 RepID=UPI00191C3BD6
MRRKLEFGDLDAVVDECRRLLRSGYTRHGNWSLGQICNHIGATIDASVDGYPAWSVVLGYPLRPFLRGFLLPRLIRGDSPAGIRTASRFVPPSDVCDAGEFEALQKSITRFRESTEALMPHPGFGAMSKESFERFHAMHAAHHLSFLGDARGQTTGPG